MSRAHPASTPPCTGNNASSESQAVAWIIMLTSLLMDVRTWPVVWRRRLTDYWRFGEKEHLAFLALLLLMILGVLGIVSFAYLWGTRLEPARLAVLQEQETSDRQRASDLQCLAENIYFEARGEPLTGQYAVAEVTLNRTHARNFPHTICQVVHQSRWDPSRQRFVADFSWTERGALFPEDGSAWRQSMTVAEGAYEELHAPVMPGALYYHATNVQPGWAKTRKLIGTIGNHVFYR